MDAIDHVAITVTNIREAVEWYTASFHCGVHYEDETWALLNFANIRLALVIPDQHPAHLGFVSEDAARFGPMKAHRDGSRSCYVSDPAGNSIEILEAASLGAKD